MARCFSNKNLIKKNNILIIFKALLGKTEDASKIILSYNQILRQYGLVPEFYNLQNREAVILYKILMKIIKFLNIL